MVSLEDESQKSLSYTKFTDGNDVISDWNFRVGDIGDGGSGYDILVIDKRRDDYEISAHELGFVEIREKNSLHRYGTILLTSKSLAS